MSERDCALRSCSLGAIYGSIVLVTLDDVRGAVCRYNLGRTRPCRLQSSPVRSGQVRSDQGQLHPPLPLPPPYPPQHQAPISTPSSTTPYTIYHTAAHGAKDHTTPHRPSIQSIWNRRVWHQIPTSSASTSNTAGRGRRTIRTGQHTTG